MTPQQATNSKFTARLLKQSFDFRFPKPVLAWESLKLFIQAAQSYKAIRGAVEFLHYRDRDDVLYLEYSFGLLDNHEVETGIGLLFSREVPHEMIAINKGFWWHQESESLSDYFSRVEETPEFRKCMALDSWEWEWS